MIPASITLREVEVDDRRVDLVVSDGRITMTAPGNGPSVAGAGGAAIVGLHDHHLHLLAMAARHGSVMLAPPDVTSAGEFDAALRRFDRETPRGVWLRGVGHEDEVAGPLDRARLDHLAPGRPIRVQHRSGALWTLSSAAIDAAGIGHGDPLPEGVELGADGAPTGRLWRADSWLRRRLPPASPPDLRPVGRRLAAWGVTGVTDATPSVDPSAFRLLADAVHDGSLAIDVTVTGGVELATLTPPTPLRRGPVKLVVPDHQPVDVDALASDIAAAHRAGRPVAVHCVSRPAAAIALAAWRSSGAAAGDRLEHASVLDLAAVSAIAELGITVVTQPAFVWDRGDHYLAHVDAADQPDLYRCASLLACGVGIGGSSDAPYGDPNPWRAVAAAVDRRTAAGRTVGPDEGLTPARALGLYLGRPDDPGGTPRRLAPGAVADLCLLDRPLAAALADPLDVTVLLTMRRGTITHLADESLVR